MHRGRKKGASLLSPKSARRLTAMGEKSCENCRLNRPYDPNDPDASICIHYDCSAPEFKHFEEKLKDGEKG